MSFIQNSNTKGTPGSKSIKRMLLLLSYFTPTKKEWGLRELAAASGIDYSSVYKLLLPLVEEGFFEKDEYTKKYKLGLKFIKYANMVENNIDLVAVSQKQLEYLARTLHGITTISIYVGKSVYHRLTVEYSNNNIIVTTRNSESTYIHTTATGKLLLSNLPEQSVIEYIKQHASGDMPFPILDLNGYLEELKNCRQNGYSIALQERFIDKLVFAVPIIDKYNRSIAAISFYKHIDKTREDDYPMIIDAMKKSARDIEMTMGWK